MEGKSKKNIIVQESNPNIFLQGIKQNTSTLQGIKVHLLLLLNVKDYEIFIYFID
jgi:hypothetical protein